MAEIVRVSNVKHVYPDGTTVHFQGHDVVVHEGERVALLGSNGSGKSTFLFHLLGLLKPTEGTVRVFDHDPTRDWERIRERIGVLLQNPDEQIIAPIVRDDIAFSPRNYGYGKEEVWRMVQQVALELGIGHLLDKVPHYLSGGERVKVALAGALVLGPKLLVLDEPFESLDGSSRGELVDLLNRLRAERGLALIVSTHQMNLVPHLVDRVYVLARGGAVVAAGTPAEILSNPDELAQHRLEAPVLSDLFWALRQRGVLLPASLTIEEAVESIATYFSARSPRRASQ